MKAIVVKSAIGTQFFVFETSEIYKHFRKICHNSSMLFLESEEDWELLIDQYLVSEIMKYQGMGIYDYEGNKYPVLKDEDGIYFIQENYTESVQSVKCIADFKDIAAMEFGVN